MTFPTFATTLAGLVALGPARLPEQPMVADAPATSDVTPSVGRKQMDESVVARRETGL
jgi:hypothetical protein